jgi:hypothetical protein
MTRILADLPEDDVKWLDAQAAEQGKSRAQLLREAVSAYRAEESKEGIEKYFGIWKDRKGAGVLDAALGFRLLGSSERIFRSVQRK